MIKQKNYRKTLIACYLGFVTQAISANYAPLLFLTFKDTYGITLKEIAMIPLVFYLTQLLVDLAATKFADKIGYRICVTASQVLSALGMLLMAFLPEQLPVPFIGILISVVLYAIGSGLIEVLVSPIVEACPFENKDGMMSLLHSFYCWGAMGVVLGSTMFFAVFGIENWKILTIIWALVPLYNAFNFINCPIERLVDDGKGMGIRLLLRFPLFWLMIILMICSGASEATMAQWASAFTESALGVSKTVGDLAGPCLFAMLMGISRILYSKFSEKLDLTKIMLICGTMCVGCYLLASLSEFPILGLAGCALCGLAVGIMWPGSISISSQKFPRGGTAMFAFLALAGDLGAMLSPAMVGSLSERAGDLKVGLLVATIFPAILVVGLVLLIFNVLSYAKKHKNEKEENPEKSLELPISKNARKRSWPIVLIIDLILIVMLLSSISWETAFGTKFFTELHTNVMKVTIGDFPIFAKILGEGIVNAFGNWSLSEFSLMLFLGAGLLGLIYRVKFNDFIKSYFEGTKKALKPAVLVVLVYVVLVITATHPVLLAICKPVLTATNGFNPFTMSIVAFLNSVFSVEPYYIATATGTLPYAVSIITDTTTYPTIAIVWQTMQGFATLIAPTSVVLIATLSYLEVSFWQWIKASWKLLLEILVALLLIFTILILI